MTPQPTHDHDGRAYGTFRRPDYLAEFDVWVERSYAGVWWYREDSGWVEGHPDGHSMGGPGTPWSLGPGRLAAATSSPMSPTPSRATSDHDLAEALGALHAASCPSTQKQLVVPTKQNAGVVNVVELGADPTGNVDSSALIQSIIDDALESGIGGVFIPRGVYRMDAPLRVFVREGRALHLFGDYPILKLTSATIQEYFLRVDGMVPDAAPKKMLWGSRTVVVQRLILDCQHKARAGFLGTRINGKEGLVENVLVSCAETGFWLRGCQGGVFRGLGATWNDGYGIAASGCIAALLDACVATDNKESGFLLTGLGGVDPYDLSTANKSFATGCNLTNFQSERNGGAGVEVQSGYRPAVATVNFVIQNGHIESNVGHGIWVHDPKSAGKHSYFGQTLVTGNRIVAGGSDAFGNTGAWARPIRIDLDPDVPHGFVITGNFCGGLNPAVPSYNFKELIAQFSGLQFNNDNVEINYVHGNFANG